MLPVCQCQPVRNRHVMNLTQTTKEPLEKACITVHMFVGGWSVGRWMYVFVNQCVYLIARVYMNAFCQCFRYRNVIYIKWGRIWREIELNALLWPMAEILRLWPRFSFDSDMISEFQAMSTCWPNVQGCLDNLGCEWVPIGVCMDAWLHPTCVRVSNHLVQGVPQYCIHFWCLNFSAF